MNDVDEATEEQYEHFSNYHKKETEKPKLPVDTNISSDEANQILDVCKQLYENAKYENKEYGIMIKSKAAWVVFENMLKFHNRC